MEILQRNRTAVLRYDVVVVGAGCAGCVAAITAARQGARTLLVERYGFLGGTSTAVLDTFYGFYTPGTNSRKVVGGVADDAVSMLHTLGQCLERPNTYGAGTGITYNSEYLKVTWDRLTRMAGVTVLLHTWMQDVTAHAGAVRSITAATKQGLVSIEAKQFVDASGDADVAWFAESPCELAGEHEDAQGLTTTFKVVNVDVPRRLAIPKGEFHRLMEQAAASGLYQLPRKEGSDHRTPVAGMMVTNMTRVQSFAGVGDQFRNAMDPLFLSEAEFAGREQAMEYLRFLRSEVPGYENAELVAFSTQIGVRESRRIVGAYRLTANDVLQARQFDDQIGICGAPIEDHRPGADTTWHYLPDGQCVGIPFRTLVPQGVDNLLVVGRCFSATHDAHASVRSMGQCMAMGQAAGTAASMAAEHSLPVAETPRVGLTDALRRAGAILE